MSRKAAREIALHSVFEYSYNARSLEDICAQKLDESTFFDLEREMGAYKKPLEARHAAYLKDILDNIGSKLEDIDYIIAKYSKNWNLRRISRVTTAILRIAIYELLHNDDIPPKVSINEAVELAKKYDTEEAAAFINGILASVFANERITGGASSAIEQDEPEIVEPAEENPSESSSVISEE